MLFCHKCRVRVGGSPRRCPLCQGELSGEAEPGLDVFPEIPILPVPNKRLISFIAFGTIAVAVITVAINIAIPSGGVWWSLFVIAGLGSLWLSFLVINNQWWNIPKIIFLQLLVISVMVLLWDFFTGFYKWSLNFVIPTLFSCSMIALAVFAKVRRLKVEDYIIFLGIISVISIFSLLLIIFHVVTIVYPAVICFALSLISLAFLLVFEGRALWEELQRRMHL
ncbi:DUF6320 domain-containing protein [Treponema primitia]|uniref:DUF6320 domain-containing protein n=1 Tax=Treponema primitia TaxID=88058 RepID=UPI000255558E|nr:DUF6320 domain-containing protein [Treponema primitia]